MIRVRTCYRHHRLLPFRVRRIRLIVDPPGTHWRHNLTVHFLWWSCDVLYGRYHRVGKSGKTPP